MASQHESDADDGQRDPSTLRNLARLLSAEIESLDVSDLINGARQAEAIRTRVPEYSGRLLAELHRRGHSWPAIARMTRISQSTCYRRAEPYLPDSPTDAS